MFCFVFYLKKHSQEAEKRGKDEKNIYGKEENKHIFMNEKRKVKKMNIDNENDGRARKVYPGQSNGSTACSRLPLREGKMYIVTCKTVSFCVV